MTRAELQKAVGLALTVGAGSSAQPAEDAPDPWTPDSALRPPLNMDQLAALTMMSGVRRSCIAAMTLNTVGLGWALSTREGMEDQLETPDQPTELARHLDDLARRDTRSHRPSFTRIMARAKWDQYEVGNGYLEVSRNKLTGAVDGLYHVPGKRIRRKQDLSGWIMGPRSGSGGYSAAAQATHFVNFGEKVEYDDDGVPRPKLADGATRWNVNELIAFQLYSSQSRDYGIPPDAQLATDYLGDKLAAKTNADYFQSSGVPPTVIFVKGTQVAEGNGEELAFEVDPALVQSIAATLKSGQTRDRVAIVPVPAGTETEKHDLAVLSERDLGFVNYRSDNRRRTLGAFRLSPIFVSDIDDAGKYTADVERAITKEQTFDPDQEETEDILDQSLVRELAPHLTLDFEEIRIKGDEAVRESANDLADRGRIQNGEYREAHGFGPLPEADPGAAELEPGQVPAGWNEELIPAQLVRGQQGTPESPVDAARLAKSGSVERAVADEFDSAVTEALRRVHSIAGDGVTLQPWVVEKAGDGGVIVKPYRNGDGP